MGMIRYNIDITKNINTKRGQYTMKAPIKEKAARTPKNSAKAPKNAREKAGLCGNDTTPHIDNAIQAAVYIRVSTDDQKDNTSLDNQRDRIAGALKMKGWELYKVYEDDGESGSKLDRPALQEMLDDIEAGHIQAVAVWKLDRLSRSLRGTIELIEDVFRPKAIELFSVSETIDVFTPTGQLMVNVLASFAQYELAVITERLSTGRKAKATKGGYAGGNAAIGYTTERGAKELHTDKDKAATVRRVFELKDKDYKLQQIADQLNIEGHTTKQGARFTPTQVMRILKRRELYAGMYVYSGITADGQHAAII